MDEKAWYGGRSRKQKGQILSPQRKWVSGQRMQRDQEPLKPTFSNISFSKVPHPKSFITSPHSTTIRGPKVQIYEPMGDISHSNHYSTQACGTESPFPLHI